MPLHAEYDEQIKGRYADIVNSESRKAHPIQGASFLKRFVGDVPWAHLDIAGTGHDNGRAYTAKGGAGWGVRLLLELARAQSEAAAASAALLGLCPTPHEPEGRPDPCWAPSR